MKDLCLPEDPEFISFSIITTLCVINDGFSFTFLICITKYAKRGNQKKPLAMEKMVKTCCMLDLILVACPAIIRAIATVRYYFKVKKYLNNLITKKNVFCNLDIRTKCVFLG